MEFTAGTIVALLCGLLFLNVSFSPVHTIFLRPHERLINDLQVIFTATYNLFFHPLRKFPGPLLWRASSYPRRISLLSGGYHLKALEFHLKYGDAVRVSPSAISYTDRK
jgi:hypothetical protein